MRLRLTAYGICGISAAGVPFRGEYTNVNALEKRTLRTRSVVSAKSSSVSVGNPTMTSVVMPMSGMAARSFSVSMKYRSLV